jgi:hypothetical protein
MAKTASQNHSSHSSWGQFLWNGFQFYAITNIQIFERMAFSHQFHVFIISIYWYKPGMFLFSLGSVFIILYSSLGPCGVVISTDYELIKLKWDGDCDV